MNAPAMVSKTPLRQVGTVRELLANGQARDQLAAVAASHMTPERVMRLLALAIDKTPQIAECTPLSILGCLMTCASLALEPNTSLHHAYIIPRKNNKKRTTEATLQIGYRGYIQLGHNSGQIAGIDAGVHYSDDEHWLYRKGAHGVLEHVPGPELGEKLHAYAVVNLVNGNAIWSVWPWAKVLAHRDRYSEGYKTAIKYGRTDNPWQTNEDAMAMKTMIRQLAKWMPMSSEIVRASAIDGARADFAGFAMDPTGGIPSPEIEDASEADAPIEGEAAETEAGTEPEQQGGEPAEEKKPAAAEEEGEPAKRQITPEAIAAGQARWDKVHGKPDPKAAADAAREKARAAAGKAEAKPAVAVAVHWREMAAEIRNSMLDIAPDRASEVLDIYTEAALDNFKQHAPELFAEVMADISARENEAE